MNISKAKLKQKEVSDLTLELEEIYWVPLLHTPFEGLNEIQRAAEGDCPELCQPFASFNANMHAAKELLEFPYFLLLPHLPIVRSHIKSTPSLFNDVDTPSGSPDRDERAAELVALTLSASKDPLLRHKNHLQRIMHQACILIWSALETFSKEVFIAALNQKPSLYTAISKNQELKERFSIANNSWSNILQSHEFTLQGKLGTIVAANRDFSSPQVLTTIFPIMFAELGGMGFLNSDEYNKVLWKLGQQRHLIAHRCSVVDQDYLDKTKDKEQKAGELLRLRGHDLARAMSAAAQFAVMLYANARHCWSRPD